jgi:hypothetical protein
MPLVALTTQMASARALCDALALTRDGYNLTNTQALAIVTVLFSDSLSDPDHRLYPWL